MRGLLKQSKAEIKQRCQPHTPICMQDKTKVVHMAVHVAHDEVKQEHHVDVITTNLSDDLTATSHRRSIALLGCTGRDAEVLVFLGHVSPVGDKGVTWLQEVRGVDKFPVDHFAETL